MLTQPVKMAWRVACFYPGVAGATLAFVNVFIATTGDCVSFVSVRCLRVCVSACLIVCGETLCLSVCLCVCVCPSRAWDANVRSTAGAAAWEPPL